MNKTLVAMMICAAGGLAHAQAPDVKTQDTCNQISEVAQSIMGSRQRGALPIGQMMKTFEGSETGQELVVRAFKKPRFETAEMQQKAAVDFASEIYMDCISGK